MRNRKSFIEELRYELRLLNDDERVELVSFYEDRFENAKFEGKTEADIISELESPYQIASNVYEQYGINPLGQSRPPEDKSIGWEIVKLILIDVFIASWAIPALYGITFGLGFGLLSFPFIFVGMTEYGLVANLLNIAFGFTAYFLTFLFVIFMADVTITFTCWIAQMHIRLVNDELANKVARFPKEFKVKKYLKTSQWKLKILIPLAAFVLIASPMIFFSSGYSQSSWFGTPNNSSFVEDTFYYEYDFNTNLDFDVVTADVTYKVADVDKIKVEVKYHSDSKLNVEKKNNTIKVNRKHTIFKISPFSLFSIDNVSRDASIVVTVPVSALLNDIDIQTVSGSLNITDLVSASSDLESISGSITIENSQSGKFDVDTVSGRVELSNLSTDELDVRTISGRVNIVNCGVIMRGVNIDTVSGDTYIKNVYKSNIKIDSVSGDAIYEIDNQNEKSSISFHSVSGELKLK